MNVLFDILHPAHVHFFRNAIAELGARGHEVRITARDKDLTLQLLRDYGIHFTCISREARTRKGLAWELASRDLRLARLALHWKTDVMASIGGISTAHAGLLTRTRNLIFYDTENATLSNLLSYPLATEVITPDCYNRRVMGRHVIYPGYHELAYLHPERFTPDPEILRRRGVNPDERFSVVRFVSWQAMHDIKARGFSLDDKRRLVRELSAFGKVYITSELVLPHDMESHRLPVAPNEIHHLLAFADLFIGESATMASESVILGTPAIYLDRVGRGYTDEQEHRYGLCFNFRPWHVEEAIAKAVKTLSENMKDSPSFRQKVSRMLAEKIDVTAYIVSRILQQPLPGTVPDA